MAMEAVAASARRPARRTWFPAPAPLRLTVANRNVEKKQKTQKVNSKAVTVKAKKHLAIVRILERGEYFGQYEKVLKVLVSWPTGTPSQQASTNNNISMENSFPSLCEREMHRFFHLKNASELRLDNIPVLVNDQLWGSVGAAAAARRASPGGHLYYGGGARNSTGKEVLFQGGGRGDGTTAPASAPELIIVLPPAGCVACPIARPRADSRTIFTGFRSSSSSVGPVYRNAYAFHRSYLEMEKVFKVYCTRKAAAGVHDGPCRSIYSTEGRFIYGMEAETRCAPETPTGRTPSSSPSASSRW
ncbi:hypothetical protein GUJ93_ZPchr0007g6299 [Zizania palustris]|uniref:Uncharacterized protein n=1 Tax=Zizania palustris TaxID=103762 RepID=A0A8J5T678_ZIZPA|nr:hypothetical protein GUJ93_ZPchr0007g6299 [Zizania palustris]